MTFKAPKQKSAVKEAPPNDRSLLESAASFEVSFAEGGDSEEMRDFIGAMSALASSRKPLCSAEVHE